ncbi:DUF928 domain-containing protein [Leptolyngbyaceae cyanobacterium CCMR0082]|uniref:DUF928 domain-containing protein n=2 Tax=Adonisia turfae TaxID=2950184 RepID=A0A6M0S9B8_9CYAN|nr:DUF928 domain-containing protein [Adonisia turfae]NEZ57440.1 DUF928 domain-containing protein [Adonisia turfae CCMR0081]NEZ64906.1 DUF928 domain-containing protein [Adonisia turfae CCMR0082]
MNRMLLSNLGAYLIGVTLGLSITVGTMTPAWGQRRLDFQPTQTGAPGNRESGANRSGACTQSEQGLVALMPDNNLAQTAASHPVVYAYFPASTAQFAEFTLYEEGSDELVYGALFNVTGNSGLVRVDVPARATVSPLRTGQRYYWYLSLICNVRERASDMTVQGSFERVSGGNVNQQLQGTSVSQQPFVYAEAGLWPETLNSLMEASRTNRATAEQNLKDLLQSVGLETLANESLLP